jgi:hypothetical protein
VYNRGNMKGDVMEWNCDNSRKICKKLMSINSMVASNAPVNTNGRCIRIDINSW